MYQNQGDRKTLTMPKPRQVKPEQSKFSNKRPAGSQRPSQHDKDLKGFKESSKKVTVGFVDGTFVTGVVVGSDKYTVKIKHKLNPHDVTFFKHSMKSFTQSDEV